MKETSLTNKPSNRHKDQHHQANRMKEFAEKCFIGERAANMSDLVCTSIKIIDKLETRLKEIEHLKGLNEDKISRIAYLERKAADHLINKRYYFLCSCTKIWPILAFEAIELIVAQSDDNGKIFDKLDMDGLEKLFIQFILRHKNIEWGAITENDCDVLSETVRAFCRFGNAKQTEWFAGWDFMIEANKMISEN